MKQLRVVWAALLIAGLVLASCTAAAPPAAPEAEASGGEAASGETTGSEATGGPVSGGTLIVARSGDATGMDPKFTTDNWSLWTQGQIFATLLQNSPDGTELYPWLAESYEANEDASEYTFHLRQDAGFCDGTPITAHDVKWSLDRAMAEDSIVNWQYPANPQVEVVDDYTVKIALSGPNVVFPSYLTLWGTHILSQAYAESVGEEALPDNPLGSGPFCLVSWEKGQRIVLERNPHFWEEGKPYVDQVEIRVVTDDSARVLQVQSGEVDVALDIPYSQIAPLQNAPGVELGLNTLYGTAAIVPNMAKVPALADLKVRQAIQRAIDRQAIVDAVLFGLGEPANSPFYGPGVLYWTDEFAVPYDLEAAKQLMAESEFPDGFTVTLTHQAGDSLAAQTAVILKDQLAQIGIELLINPVDPGAWWEMWSGKEFEMIYKLGTNDVIDPGENIPFDFWSAEEGGADSAFSGYRNEEIVRLSKEAEAELDPAVRAELYREIQRIAMEESPQFYIFHPYNRWVTTDKVEGFQMLNTGLYRLWEAWKVE